MQFFLEHSWIVVSAVVCRILLHLYTNQIMCIKWSGFLSEHFCVMNGVRQGGDLSPTLFTLYLDHLFHFYINNKRGCHIGHVYTGAFGYADDIILMAPSKCALNKMVNIAATHSIIFNAHKCKYLVFGNNGTHIHSVKFNDVVIFASTWEKHLGNHLDANDSDRHISQAIHLLYFRFNSVMHKFYSAISDLKYFLFKTYYMAFYGCQLWNLESVCVDKFYVAWRKCCRRLLDNSI